MAVKVLVEFLKGKWLKHPLHPILAHIPVAAWPGALLFDLLSRSSLGGAAMVRLSLYAIVLGLAATLLAVPTGLADWTGIKKDKPAWKLGLYHMALNLVVAVLFAVNLGLRLSVEVSTSEVRTGPLALSAIGTVLLFVSSYLGGMMVYDQGISVAKLSKNKWRRKAEAGGATVPAKSGK